MKLAIQMISITFILMLVCFNSSNRPSSSALAQTPTANNMEVVGHVGGSIEAVFVQGDYAYIGQGTTLAVLDVSNPASPILVGKTAPLPGVITTVHVSGSYAYVADIEIGMSVIDISNPDQPAKVGFYPLSDILKIQTADHYVYVAADYDALFILDVANPAQPIEVNSYQFDAKDFVISGQHAYLVGGYYSYQGGNAGLRILDISDPNNLLEIGVYASPPWYTPEGIALSENFAYIIARTNTNDQSDTLLVVDIADVTTPVQVNQQDVSSSGSDIELSSNFLYLAGERLWTFNIADPQSPVEVGYYEVAQYIWDLHLIGNQAYLASSNQLDVLDVSNPTQPNLLATFQDIPWPLTIASTQNYAYIGGSTGLHVVDISDPTIPSTVNTYPNTDYINDIVLRGSYAYLATGHAYSGGSLHILDIANPTVPLAVGVYQTPFVAKDVAIAGRYAYLADERALRIIDLANPANPVEVGTFQYRQYGISLYVTITVKGIYAYVADSRPFASPILRVIDISNPTNPQEVSSLVGGGGSSSVMVDKYFYSSHDLQILGSDAFLSGGLSIIDVSNPEAPTPVSRPDTTYSSVLVVDISDPGAPVETGNFSIPSRYESQDYAHLGIINGYLYAAAPGSGLYILRHIGTPYIEGRIADPQGRPLAGVTVTSSLGESATTGADGTYTFERVTPGAHTLTPSLPNFTFEPPSRTVTVPPNANGQDFAAQPVPVSAQLTLGSGAASLPASLTYTDPQGNAFDFAFPAGAVSQPTEIILTPIPLPTDDGPTHFKYAFELTALQNKQLDSGFPFNQPVTVSVHYNDDSLGGAADEAQLTLRWWTGNGWRDAAQTCDPGSTYVRDTEANTFQVAICHLSQFSPFEPETLSVCSQHVQVCPLDEASWIGEADAWQETGKKWQRDLNTPAGINVMWEWNNPYPGSNALYADHRENPYADYTNTPDDVIVPGSHPIVFEWERWSETTGNYLLHQFGGDTESTSSFVGTTDCEDGIFFPVIDHTHPYAYTPMVVKHNNGDCAEGGYIVADLIELWGAPLSQERMQRCDDPALGIPADQTPRGNALCKISPHVGMVFQHYARPANPAQSPNPIVGCEGAVYAWGWPEPDEPGGNTGQDYEVWFRNGELRLTRYHSLNTPTIPAPDDRDWWNPRCEQAWEQRTNWLYDGVYRIGQTIYTDTITLPIQETAVVPTGGGAITSTIDGTVLSFAPDTFNDTVILTRTLLAQSDLPDGVSLWGTDLPAGSGSLQDAKALAGINRFYQLTAVYSATGQPAQPLKPYTVTISYADGDIGPAAEATIGLYTWDGQLWLRETSSQVFTATNTLQAMPQHFSLWGALGQTQQIYLPLVVR